MKGIIFAENDRDKLLPLSVHTTKAMLNFFDAPLIETQLKLFQKHGISDITVITEQKNLSLENYLHSKNKNGIRITHFVPPENGFCLETIAGDCENCMIFNQLLITDIDLNQMIQFHKTNQSTATMMYPTEEKELHKVTYQPDGTIKAFYDFCTSRGGIFLIHKNAYKFFIKSIHELFPVMLAKNMSLRLLYKDGYFRTIHSLNDYLQIAKESLENKFLLPGHKNSNGVILNKNTFIEVGAKIKPPVYIGENVSIQKNAEILPYSIVCKNTVICENAKISNSLIFENCHIMKNASVNGAVLASHVTVCENATVTSGAVFGQYTKIPSDNMNRLEKNKTTNQQDNQSVVFEKSNLLFPKEHLHSFLFRLGCAVSSLFTEKSIGLFKDDSAEAELYSHSLLSGLKASGAAVCEFPDCTFAMSKSACRTYGFSGGIYLFKNGEKIMMNLLDQNGHSISQPQEEALQQLFRQSKETHFRTPLMKSTAEKPYQPYYFSEIVKFIDNQKADISVVLQTDSKMLSDYFQKLAGCLGIKLLESNLPGKIRFECDGAGKQFRIYSEDGTRLTSRQIETIIAALLIEKKEPAYVATIFTSESTIQLLEKHHIPLKETKTHTHELDILLSEHPRQYYLSYDPVYLIIEMLLYLQEHQITLTQWLSRLPKSFFIEKTITAGEQLADAVAKLIRIAKSNYIKDDDTFKIESKKGVTIVTPEEDKLKFISESQQEEYAKELTDFYVSQCIDTP